MHVKVLYSAGKLLGQVLSGTASFLAVIMLVLVGPMGGSWGSGAGVALAQLAVVLDRLFLVWLGGVVAAVVVHECGHLLACLALGVKVREFRIGRPGARAFQFQLRGVTVALGSPVSGQVRHDPRPFGRRSALIVAAGPLANLVVACVLLAVGLATAPVTGFTAHLPLREAIELALAAMIGATGIANLLPFRSKWGRLSDGARLLAHGNGKLARAVRNDEVGLRGPDGATWRPADPKEAAEYKLDSTAVQHLRNDPRAKLPPELLDKWLAAYRDRTYIGLVTAWALGRTLRLGGRIDELVELLWGYPAPQGRLAPAMTHSLEDLAYEVVLVPGMPPRAINVAIDRLQWAIRFHGSIATPEDRMARAAVLHSMAVARLRLGHFDVVEDLCAMGLATPELPPGTRATVLATVALARQALGQPYEGLLAEAVALDPQADLVAEAAGWPAAAGI